MNHLTRRVQCAYCHAMPMEEHAFLLAERRAWRLWLCARCVDLSAGLWLDQREPLPPAIAHRLDRSS